ncbi:hypothetical protein QVD17_37106 [Tagetes erecta]|uniref:Cysteine-rich receptor-like protein kinase 2 n=1 Tax=Tagetes erecta TaxID=13708 RepID=A0AAD8NI10_TARER|nr:hypothetical protein QVD17_37106 [Tagetes erecta]
MSPTAFSRNLNSTFTQLRSRLSNTGVYYATAQSLENIGDAVYGVAQCRNYLLSTECLACFDVAVSVIEPRCGSANGAHVFLDNCFLRFENYNQFYYDPQGGSNVGIIEICGKESTSQPTTTFNQVVKELLSDIKIATPKTSDFYTASTKPMTSGVNTTVYAIAQCVENASQAICKNCLSAAYNNLSSCLPANEGRALNVACLMMYSVFPFFQNNQTTNLIPFLSKGSSSKPGIIIKVCSGGGLVMLILALFFLFRWKKSKAARKGSSDFRSTQLYTYEDLKLATSNFSEEYRIGKGGFGEVFKAIVDGGNVVAVKKLHVAYDRAKREFENEVILISNVRHRNLILQLGWCIDGPELLLVLEYMPKERHGRFWNQGKRKTNPVFKPKKQLRVKNIDTWVKNKTENLIRCRYRYNSSTKTQDGNQRNANSDKLLKRDLFKLRKSKFAHLYEGKEYVDIPTGRLSSGRHHHGKSIDNEEEDSSEINKFDLREGENKGTLNWKQRFDIIFGIARGLAHLHGECHVKIIHRDIKSCNILLDNDFQPKITDFGLARLFPDDETHISTRFAGTMGYTPPEYATRGHLSEKVDIYSFGIVALEVISGRSCSDVNYSGPQMEYLLNHAWRLYEKGIHMKLVDEAIDPNEYQEENVMKVIETALLCTQSPASLRPTMSEV